MEVALGQIYLVRHGQTAWNKAKIFRGRRDVPLNEPGRLEAAAAAKALREVALGRIYTSPLSRARETAETMAAGRGIAGSASAPLRVVADEAFTDIDYGEWTGYSDLEARQKFPELYQLWMESPHLVKFPGGESLADVRRRAVPRLIERAEQHLREAVALVSHRVVLKLLLCEAKGLDNSHFWAVRLDTGAISMLEYETCPQPGSGSGKLRVAVENDARHLCALTGHGGEDF